jgi:hypothetical protein
MTDREDTQRNFNHEDEIRGHWINMGNGRTESNGHDEGKEESINLVETIKNMQKYVQSYKEDNERLRKSKEQQDGFNINSL